jgi:hypothetical protein
LDNGTVLPPLSLRCFCEAAISENPGAWPPEEGALARRFVSFFQLSPVPRLQELETLCRRLGVQVALAKMPAPLRGHNCCYQDRKEILITDLENVSVAMGSREHTLLHELRELLEYEFVKLGKPTATGAELERRAEAFASQTRAIASIQMWKPILDSTAQIQSTLLRIAAVIGLVLALWFYSFACLTLPRLEDYLES